MLVNFNQQSNNKFKCNPSPLNYKLHLDLKYYQTRNQENYNPKKIFVITAVYKQKLSKVQRGLSITGQIPLKGVKYRQIL